MGVGVLVGPGVKVGVGVGVGGSGEQFSGPASVFVGDDSVKVWDGVSRSM